MSEPRSSALMDFQSTYAAVLDGPHGRAVRRGLADWPWWARLVLGAVLLAALLPALAVGTVAAVAGGALLLGWEAARHVRQRRRSALSHAAITHDLRRR